MCWHAMESSPGRRWLLPWLIVGTWLVLQAIWSLPDDIASDWNGWRQSDTQTIAENFVLFGDDILNPRVNWGGDGPGYVESELQVYTWLSAGLMRAFGTSPRPGQWLSLLAAAATGLILSAALRSRFGFWPGLLGLVAFLTTRGVIFTSSAVQPDAFGLLFFTTAMVLYLQYLEKSSRPQLLSAAILTLFAALIKPTFLLLGIFQFLATVWLRRDLLRTVFLWVVWATILAGVSLFFLYQREIYTQYGNTFGIGFGGDSKFPTLAILLDPGSYPPLIRMAVAWGLGLPGALAGLYLLIRRQLDAVAVLLGLSISVMLLLAYRYTSYEWYGPHYHIVSAVLAAWLVAGAARDIARIELPNLWRTSLLFSLAIVLIASGLTQWHLRSRNTMVMPEQLDSVAAGHALRDIADPEDLIVVRSSAPARSERFNTENNFQDPIVFYVSGLRGWILPADEPQVQVLENAARAGARFYVDTYGRCNSEELAGWLQVHAQFVQQLSPRVVIYRLEYGT